MIRIYLLSNNPKWSCAARVVVESVVNTICRYYFYQPRNIWC
ncbi:cyclic lactone autoinducer peptide [Sodalis ligni]|nr:cyclic lactone autoinducer peptide [Sodalis ligni]